MRPHWQRDGLIANPHRLGEATGVIPILATVVSQSGHWMGIIDAGADPGGIEAGDHCVPLLPVSPVQNQAQAVVAVLGLGELGYRGW